jgi:hypothetical protein
MANLNSFHTLSKVTGGTQDTFIVKYDTNGIYKWATQMGGNSTDAGNGISTDSLGNVYVTGYFTDTSLNIYDASAYKYAGVTSDLSLSRVTGGYQDTFIVKYDTNGNYQWATQMGGTSHDVGGNGISTDSFGNVYVTGVFSDASLNIYDASAHKYIAGVTSDLSLSNIGGTGYDVFIVKYDTSGNYCWATQMGGTSHDGGNSISTDSLGNVYITGSFSDTSLNIYDASAHKYAGVESDLSLSNVGGGYDVFIVKYDTSGNYCWATQMGGTASDIGTGISTDSLGNVYVTGYFNDTSLKIYDASAHKYAGVASDLSLSNVGGPDVYIVKYDTSGNYKWATQMGGTSHDAGGNGISTDFLGNVYVTGYFNDTSLNIYDASAHKYIAGVASDLSLSNIGGGYDVFIVKYDTSGNYCWATQMGGFEISNDYGMGISTDHSGNVYVTGSFSDISLNIYDASAHKYAGVASDLSLSNIDNSGQDVFIVKYDTNGVYKWATQMGKTSYDEGTGISTDFLGNVYVTGFFQDTSLNIYDAIQIVNNIPVANICFPAGTPITVDQGIVAIENINPAIHTIRGKHIYGVSKTTSQYTYLVCLEKDALGTNSPNKRTLISPLHKIMHKNEWVIAKDLLGLNRYKIKQVAYNGEPLYNVIMQTHESMLVNNMIAETLHPSNPIAKPFIKNV